MEKRLCSKLAVLLSLLLVLQSLLTSVNVMASTSENVMASAPNSNILPPSNLSYELTTPKDVKLTWNSVYGATGYNIYGITEGQLLLLATTASTAYSFNNLPEATYSYVVSTLSSEGESGPCAPINVNIEYPDMEAPANLTNTFRNVNDIVLSWTASKYAESYNIYQITADNQKALISTATGSTYTITNATAGSMAYAVSSVNSLYGESPLSTPLDVSVVYPDMAAPSNISFKIQNGNDAVLTWKAVTYADSYNIYELFGEQKNLISTVPSISTTISNLSAGEHTYVIHSLSSRFGESTEGIQITLTVDVQNMQAPANLTYTLNNGKNVTLKWNSVTYATAYKVYQLVDGEKHLKSTVSTTNVAFNDLAIGNYEYVVHSYSDKFGESAEGSQVSVNIGEVTMSPPSNFTYSISNGNDIVLSWSSVPNVTNYKVYQIINEQKILKSTLTGTTVSYANLPEGSYTYEIISYSTIYGESEGSQLTIKLTLPVMQAPANLVQSLKSPSDFSLSWEASSFANSYKVYQIVDGKKVLKSTVSATTVSYTNMAPGEYSYMVHSYSSRFGESPEGSSLTFSLNGQTMEAPTNLTYTLANENDITLKWTAAPYSSSYKIYRVIGEEKTLQKTTAATSITFSNMPADDYHYIVTSVSTLFGESPSGAEVKFTLVLPTMTAPDNLKYTIQNANTCVLTWDQISYANSYKVYELINEEKVLKATVSTLTAKITNLSVGNHTYIVHSVSSRFGESAEGSKISFALDIQMLAPADLEYSISNGNDIVLKWTAAENANSYKVYQVIDNQKTLLKTVTATTITFANMPAREYKYVVTSMSTVFGESINEADISVTLVHPIMAAPENLAYSIKNVNSAVFTWTAANYANSYKVYEVVDGKEVLKTTVSTLTATIANVSVGDHTFVVRSFSTRFGESAQGSKLSFKLEQQMLPPTELTYTIANGNDITLKWTAAQYANSYKIYQVVDNQNILQKTVTTATVTFTNMAAGEYEYIITSVSNVFGESAEGSKITLSLIHPTMDAPENLAYKIQDVNSAVLTWTAVNYATSYKVYEIIDGQKVLKTTVSSPTATIANLSVGDHSYVVHSVSTRFGESQKGSNISLTLYQQMLPPTNLSYSLANGNDITLKWTAAQYANSYNVYKLVGEQRELVQNITTATVKLTNMPAENYNFIITSVSKVFGESADGAEINVELVHPIMEAPGNFTKTITNGNDITLNWNAATYATQYRVYQIIDGQKTLVKALTARTISFTNMPQGDYIYEVDSYSDRFGESPVGNTVNFSLIWPVVNAPVLQHTIYNVNNITFTWQAVNWANEYRVYKVTDSSRELLYKGTALTYKIYNLSEDTHSFEVTAYNTRFGESVSSNRITENIIYPDMEAPALSVKLVGTNEVQLIWNFITYANGYNVYEIVDGEPVLLVENLNNLSYQVKNLSYEDHQFYVTSYSNSFGESHPSSTVIAKLDTEAPVTTCDAPTGWVSKMPVVVNLHATDSKIGVENTYYSVNDSDFEEGTSFTVDKDGINKISFYSVDKLGNKEALQTAYIKIDITTPVTTANASENWSKDNVSISLAANDEQSGVANTLYSIDGSAFSEGTSFTVKGEGIHKISFYSVDTAGNKEAAKSIVIKIDTTAPVTTVVSPVDTEKFYTDNVSVSLAASDEQSGVANTLYSIDGSDFTGGTSFTVNGEGTHKISFYSVDTAGNKEAAKSIVVKIDTTAPVTTANAPENWSKDNVSVSLTATDEQSGVANTLYSIDGSDFTKGTSFTVKDEGTHKISFYSVDTAGNKEAAKSIVIKIDTTAPVTTVVSPVDTEKFYTDNVSVNLTATDEQSGVANTLYSIDGSDFTKGTSFTVKGEGTHKISFYSVDTAGNKETAKSIVVKIDTTAPVTTVVSPIDTEKFYTDNVSVSLAATDEQSGVANTLYSIDGSDFTEGTSFTVKGEGTHKISFYSVDTAGNKEAAKSIEIKIGNSKPVISMDLNPLYKLCSIIKLKYTVDATASKIVSQKMTVQVPNCKKEIVVANNSCFILAKPGTYTVTVTVKNAAGVTTTLKKQFVVYIPVAIDVTPKVINNNSGILTARVCIPSALCIKNFDINTATLNGVKALTNNNGYYNQAKLGQFNFRRSDFNWNQPKTLVELRCYVDGYLLIGQTTVNVKNTQSNNYKDCYNFGNFWDFLDFRGLYDLCDFRDFDLCDFNDLWDLDNWKKDNCNLKDFNLKNWNFDDWNCSEYDYNKNCHDSKNNKKDCKW